MAPLMLSLTPSTTAAFGWELMETEQALLQVVDRKLLKAAVNVFCLSIRHHGKYHCVTDSNVSCEAKVTCTWLDGRIWGNERISLYICDTTAFDRLQTAAGKISVIDRGVAVPHVNLRKDASIVEWLMFPNDTALFPDLARVSLCNKWFLIHQEFQGIFDYVAQLHNLIPSTLSATLTNQVTEVLSFEHVQSGPQSDATLNIMIVKPGGIFASIFPSPNPKDTETITPETFIIYPKCDAQENSFMGLETMSSNVSAVTDEQLRYHHVTNKFSAYLQDFISHLHQCKENKSFSESEITIKEEPLLTEGIFRDGSDMCDLRDHGMIISKSAKSTSLINIVSEPAEEQAQPKLSKHCLVQSSPKRPERRMLAQEFNKHFGVLLQCPKCSVAFKYGVTGQGLSLLIHHVHAHHKSSITHCISVLRQRYTAVLKDVKLFDRKVTSDPKMYQSLSNPRGSLF